MINLFYSHPRKTFSKRNDQQKTMSPDIGFAPEASGRDHVIANAAQRNEAISKYS